MGPSKAADQGYHRSGMLLRQDICNECLALAVSIHVQEYDWQEKKEVIAWLLEQPWCEPNEVQQMLSILILRRVLSDKVHLMDLYSVHLHGWLSICLETY